MWTIDSTRVYVQEIGDDLGQIIPRLQPLAGKTVLQVFGNESSVYKLKFKVVGYDDLNIIKSYVHDGATHTILESPSGIAVSGYFNQELYIRKMSYSRDSAVRQYIREDLDCYTPVFTGELELYLDEN